MNFIVDGPERNMQRGGFVNLLAYYFRKMSSGGCEARAEELGKRLIKPDALAVNIGGNDGRRWPNIVVADAIYARNMDFNTVRLPWDNNSVDFIICEQVIEHLHNTTWFLSELHRILKPGGRLLLATEGLSSLPNIFALLCGKVPFSLQPCCGEYIGGWCSGSSMMRGDNRPHNHPTFSGVNGHVRVLTRKQCRYLLKKAGFEIEIDESFGLGHYILFLARKV